MSGHDDFEVEPIPGLPEKLPEGERLLWQGSPDPKSLAIHAFHVRKVAVYFGLLALWILVEGLHDGVATAQLASNVGLTLALGVGAVIILGALAWASARSAIYSLTNRRLVMRFGVAIRLSLNLPYNRLQAVALRRYADGTGDVPVRLSDDDKISYAILWPHARPWRLKAPQPMLRCVPEPDRIAESLGGALSSDDGSEAFRFAGGAVT